MSLTQTTSGVFNNYNKLIKNINLNKISKFKLDNINSLDLNDRLYQIIISYTFRDYHRLYDLVLKNYIIDINQNYVKIGKLVFYKNGDLRLSNHFYFYFAFLKNLFLILKNLTISFFFKKKSLKNLKLNLIIIDENLYSNVDNLEKFFHENKQTYHLNNHINIINCFNTNKIKITNEFIYTSNFVLEILKFLNIFDVTHLIFKYFILFFKFSLNNFNSNIYGILYSDILYVPLFDLLNKKKIISNIFITASDLQRQTLWMKGLKNQSYKLNILWYGENAMHLPRRLKDEYKNRKKDHLLLPFYRYIRADNSYVWTSGFSNFLIQNSKIKKCTIVEPIIFSSIKIKNNVLNNTRKQILVFDISPSSISNCGEYNNYTSFINIKKYLIDICELIQEIQPDVVIKLKIKKDLNLVAEKGYAKVVGLNEILKEYKNFLNDLCKKYSNLKIINNNNVDVVNEIRKSVCCISLPYSSSLLLSSFFKKKSAFYDPTNNLINTYSNDNQYIDFISNKSELNLFLSNNLND